VVLADRRLRLLLDDLARLLDDRRAERVQVVIDRARFCYDWGLRHELGGVVPLVLSILAFATTSAEAQQSILGKTITFRAAATKVTTQLRVLKDGHILISNPGGECRTSGGGDAGGEAIIGQSMTTSFSCINRGRQLNYTTSSTASFDGSTLTLRQTWVMNGEPNPGSQDTTLVLQGATCSGSFMGNPIVSCSVR